MEFGTLINRRPGPRAGDSAWWPIVAALLLAAAAGALVGSGDWDLAVGVVAAAAFLIAAIAAPERTTLAMVATLPFFFYPASVGGFSLFLALPTFGFVSIVLLMRAQTGLGLLRRDLPVVPFTIVFGLAAVAATLSEDSLTAFSRVIYVLLFAIFALAIAAAIADGRMTRQGVARAILTAGGFAGVALVIQFLAQYTVGQQSVLDWLFDVRPTFAGERASEIRASNWAIADPDVVRAVFPFMAPPAAGQFLMFALISGIWLRRERAAVNTARDAAETVLLVIVAAALLATLSRQSWLGAGAGALALAIGRRPGRAVALFMLLALIVAVVPIPGSSQSFGNYLLSASDTSTTSTDTRLDLWTQTLELIPDHAMIGAGPGLITTLGPGASKRPFYAHNVFLDAAVELGIFGALALLAMFLAGLGAAYRRRASLTFSLLVAYLVAGLFDDVLYTPRNGLLLALAFALIADRRSTESPEPGWPRRS